MTNAEAESAMNAPESPKTRGGLFPRIGVRVGMYLVVIAAIYFYKFNQQPVTEPAPLPTVHKPAPEPEHEEPGMPVDITTIYPQLTFYAWTAAIRPDGTQRVEALVRFTGNLDDLHWKELKLRRVGDDRDLAEAQAPEGQPRPQRGLAKLVFELSAGAKPFDGGRVFCWVRDLFLLEPERRVSAEQLDQALTEAQNEEAGAKTKP